MVIDAEFEEIEDDATNTEGELDLSEDDSLPWLESDEDDEAAGGVDTTQVIGFAVVLIVLLLAIVGAIYMISNRGADQQIVADGSTIEAPDTPIKERPDDPGGKEFAGTGNVAPAVGEGQTREGQMRSDEASAQTAGSAESAAQSPPSATEGVGVQLAAYSSRARAEQGWSTLVRQTEVLSGVRHRVVEGVVDGGTVYRLQAVAADGVTADKLCADLKADGLDCAVKR